MLDRLLSILPQGNPKNPLMYLRMIDSINVRLNLMKNKFLLGHGTQTAGVELLRFFILNIDLEEILAYESDIDRFTNIIDFVENTYKGAFDPIYKGKIESGLFMQRTGPRVPEFMMNTEFDNKIADYPFDKPYQEWNKLRAVRIIHHDSLELVNDLHTWWIKFTDMPPSYMLYSIDIRTLVFKWVKYVEYCRSSGIEPDDMEFLKHSELVHWHDDLFNIWLFNCLNIVVTTHDEPEPEYAEVNVDPYIASATTIDKGFQGVNDFITLVKQGSVRLQDMLETKWINGMTVMDRIAEQKRYVRLPELRQYRWLEIIRWLPYLKFVLNLNKWYPNVGVSKMISDRARDIMNRDLKFQNLENNLIMPEAKAKLKQDLEDLKKLVQ